jgi:hypothetical protein
MKTNIIITETFEKEFKRLKKKYKSLPEDLRLFEEELLKNPLVGIDLGGNVRKIRVSIKSKNKGKSGGARIITYTVVINILLKNIFLITIFDKSEKESISDNEIKILLKKNGFL